MPRVPCTVLAVLSMAVVLSSCDDKPDTTRPVAEILSPPPFGTVTTEDGLLLRARFTDDAGLLQYRVIIDGIDSLNGLAKDTVFRIILVDGLSGTEQVVETVIPLPSNAFNAYQRIRISCVDKEGNESLPDTVAFRLVNSIDSIAPVIGLTVAVYDTVYGLGEGFALLGQVTDNRSLTLVTVQVGRTGSAVPEVLNAAFQGPEAPVADISAQGWYFEVNDQWAKGNYAIRVTAWDEFSVSHVSIPFKVDY